MRRALKTGQAARFGPPKSRAGRRTVPLPATLAMALRLRRAESEWCDDASLVFPSSRGTPMMDGNLRFRTLAPAARAAGVGWMGFHTLRHSFASLLFKQGRNIRQVCVLMGHADPAFTLRTYVHLLAEDTGGALDLDAVFGTTDQSIVQASSRVGAAQSDTPSAQATTPANTVEQAA